MFFKKSKAQNVFTSFFHLYIFLKIFGMFLPSFDGKISEGKFSAKLFDKLFTILIFVATTYVLKLMMTINIAVDLNSSLFMIVAYKFAGFAALSAVLIIIIYQTKYQKEIVNILKTFQKFDDEVRKFKNDKFK